MSFHKCIAFGRATADAKIITSKEKKKFATFSLAVNNFLGEERGTETTYYECLVFGPKQIDSVGDNIKKGDVVVVDGIPSVDAYISNKKTPKANLKLIVNSYYMFKDTKPSESTEDK